MHDVDTALEIAAVQIEHDYQHGLHEHGIPVPEMLRSLKSTSPALRAAYAALKAAKERMETLENPERPHPPCGCGYCAVVEVLATVHDA